MNTIICEQNEHTEIFLDVYTKLASDRILFINGAIDDNISTDIIATLLLKDYEDSNKKINLFINSDGGDIRSCFMIYDIIKIISSPIQTICLGSASDGAAMLLAAGTPGMRFCTENSVITFNQLTTDSIYYSNLTDAQSILKRCLDDNDKMMKIISKCTKQPYKNIIKKFDRRVFMKSQDALKNGFLDKVIKIDGFKVIE